MRGTSGTLRHTKRSRYRCSLPGLAGFAGLRRTEPEVPRIGSRSDATPSLGWAAKRVSHRAGREKRKPREFSKRFFKGLAASRRPSFTFAAFKACAEKIVFGSTLQRYTGR